MSRLVVTDTSCLIALDRVGRLDILPALFVVHAPEAVADEWGQRPPWLHVERVDPLEVEPLLRVLDRGEAEAIVLARSHPGARLLMDEARGRRYAQRLGLSVTGTGGLLVAAKAAGEITHVRPLLDALVRNLDFRLSGALYDEILRLAGET